MLKLLIEVELEEHVTEEWAEQTRRELMEDFDGETEPEIKSVNIQIVTVPGTE